jgi:hypothetical protein
MTTFFVIWIIASGCLAATCFAAVYWLNNR